MEIIYIYVRNYKVLKDKDFSLCSNYKVIRRNDVVVISDSSIKNGFFNDNIDITALFGKNGTGKSTLTQLISSVFSNDLYSSECVLIFKYHDEIYYFSNIEDDFHIEYVGVRVNRVESLDPFFKKVIYFSHGIDNLTHKPVFNKNKNFKYIDCSSQKGISTRSKIIKKNQVRDCFDLLDVYNMQEYGISSVPMIGTTYPYQEISSYLKSIVRKILSKKNTLNFLNSILDVSFLGRRFLDSFKELLELFIFDSSAKYLEEDYIENYHDIFIKNKLYKKASRYLLSRYDDYFDLIYFLNSFDNVLNNEMDERESFYVFVIYIEFLSGRIYLNSMKALNNLFELDGVFSLLNHTSSLTTSEYKYKLFHVARFIEQTFSKNDLGVFNIESYEAFEYIDEFVRDENSIFKNIEIEWNGISSGQHSLLVMFSRLYKEIKDGEDVIVFIDEGETYLHPEWQRKYVRELIKFFSAVREIHQKINIIITSHSPFVLSDLPEESVNFLDAESAKGNFFGANIFDIFNKGMLVERTVGEFAYEKISKAINNKRENIDSAENIISMIADPIVRKLAEKL
ncbi:AAA family ATPase [Pokkaliibacter sp. CJK22405]|uniref:AAA family ATPase n=1 Tax=Pokkaliibacter sp. CJK22405 TaxID=3384615 RepID=UPI0039849D51